MVNQQLLCKTIEFLGMHGMVYKWLNSYPENIMSTWFAVKSLILIIYKTNYMLFGNRMFIEDVINIQNVKIERVSCKMCGCVC